MQVSDYFKGTIVDEIFFIESDIACDYEVLSNLSVKSLKMNDNLANLKKRLALQAKAKGANAVINYAYGQKRSLMSMWDDTKWHASGTAVRVDLTRLRGGLKKKK